MLDDKLVNYAIEESKNIPEGNNGNGIDSNFSIFTITEDNKDPAFNQNCFTPDMSPIPIKPRDKTSFGV